MEHLQWGLNSWSYTVVRNHVGLTQTQIVKGYLGHHLKTFLMWNHDVFNHSIVAQRSRGFQFWDTPISVTGSESFSLAWGDFYIASHLDNPRFGVKDWDDAKQAPDAPAMTSLLELPWCQNLVPSRSCFGLNLYPGSLTMENHHFLWENPRFSWPFAIAMFIYQRASFLAILPLSSPLFHRQFCAIGIQLWTTRFKCHWDCETCDLETTDFIGVMVTNIVTYLWKM